MVWDEVHVVASFVDIFGIIDTQFLNFSFIIRIASIETLPFYKSYEMCALV
jgi:hypothetical protein